MKKENITKATAIIGFVLFIVAMITARNSPAIGFESSIYLSTPLTFWLFLVLGIGAGIFIVIFQIYQRNLKNNLWILGLLLILIGNIVVLSLPVIRGYYLWDASGDTATHIGIVQDLLKSGHFETGLFYPFTHIFLAQMSEILGIGIIPIVNRVMIIFDILYMVFLYLTAKALLPRKEQILLTCLAGAALIQSGLTYGWFNTLTPNSLGSLLFPLILFLLIKGSSSSFSWQILFIIIIILVPIIHVILAFTLLVILVSLRIIERIMYSKARLSITSNEFVPIKPAWGIILLSLFWTCAWISISSSSTWGQFGSSIIEALKGGSNQVRNVVNNIATSKAYGYSPISYFMRIYLIPFIYGIIALLTFPVLLRKRTNEPILRRVIAFYSPLAAITLIMLIFYFLKLPFEPARLEIYIEIILFIIVGFLLFEFIRWSRTRNRAFSFISIVIAGLFLIGASFSTIATLYPSPFSYQASLQNTRSEISGMDWFLKQKDVTIYSAGWEFTPFRYADFLLNTEERQTRNDFSISVTKQLPFHFGYDLNSNLGSYFNSDVYVVLMDLDRKLYSEIYPKMANIRLLPSDFNKLDQDSTVNKLYENGGFEVYYVNVIR